MRVGQTTGVILEPSVWCSVLALDLFEEDVKTWAIHNVGANAIADGKLQVCMRALDAPDAEWFDHPDTPVQMTNIAAGTWATATSSGHAFPFYRLYLRSAMGSTVDAYVRAR